MLKDLNYFTTYPRGIYEILTKTNGINLDDEEYFEHYATGVYRHDGYMFNFDGFIDDLCEEKIINKWVAYGVCEDYLQVLEKYEDLLSDANTNYVIGLSIVRRESQPQIGGWRWHKWGEYIGSKNPTHEYIYDDTHIDSVYCYHIYEIY